MDCSNKTWFHIYLVVFSWSLAVVTTFYPGTIKIIVGVIL